MVGLFNSVVVLTVFKKPNKKSIEVSAARAAFVRSFVRWSWTGWKVPDSLCHRLSTDEKIMTRQINYRNVSRR